MPRGPIGGFAQAADFYDSVGLNHHPEYMPGNEATAIARMQELGVRHVRSGLFSPANHSNLGYASQDFGLALKNANAARAAGVQPIFELYGTVEEPASRAATNGEVYDITNANGSHLRPLDGPAGTVGETYWPAGTKYAGEKYTAAGPFRDIGWGVVGGLQGTNEPDGRAYYPSSIRTENIRALKNAKNARTTEVVLGGGEYISSSTGRITPGPAYAPQLPVAGFALVGNNWEVMGDYSDGLDLDVGSPHIYWGGHEPNYDEFWSYGQNSGRYNLRSYNGALSAGGRWSRSVPLWVTETGYIHDVRQDPGVVGPQRFCPPDVSGEYMIRTFIHNYLAGCKRTYWYKLNDEGAYPTPIPAMGLLPTTWVRRACFYALKNLMALVGWVQGTDTPVSVAVSGFSAGGPNISNNPIGGGVEYSSPDRLHKLILKRNDGYLVILVRDRSLWNRGTQTRITVPDPQTVTLTLPAGAVSAAVAEPAKNVVLSPNDGLTYANPTNGTAYDPLTITSNQVDVEMGALTRIVKVTT